MINSLAWATALPYVDLSNEASRREILISKVATELIHYTQAKLRIEYPIVVTQQCNVE